MAVNLSPGVTVTEIDLTTTVTQASSSTGAIAIDADWGPVGEIITTTNEDDIVNFFGSPNNNNYVDFFSAASFLAYTSDLRVVRAANTGSLNARANASTSNIQVKNEADYEYRYLDSDAEDALGSIIAKYPGTLGNGLTVEFFDSTDDEKFKEWTYSSYFSDVPGTSNYTKKKGGSNDEFHMVVVDGSGKITGTRNTVINSYGFVSKAKDAIDDQGDSIYWKNVLLQKDNYVYGVSSPDYENTKATWGVEAYNTTFARTTEAVTKVTLVGGTYVKPDDSDYMKAYGLFNDVDNVDVSLMLTSNRNNTVVQYIIDNICTEVGSEVGRNGTTMCFVSPPKDSVLFADGVEATNIQEWLNTLARTTTYCVCDCNWKYMYDKYNKMYRWIPCSSDVAGLCAYTDKIRNPWWSPAGLNRGKIKNAVKLAWNPNKTNRDIIYPLGVNPIFSMTGEGIVLYGDKTLTRKPSAFDRINVRRLFIVLEKSISNSAKYSLFEFNDEQTRASFVATIEPFLRNVKSLRGIYDFKVVCDSSNNTPYVIDNNQFVGDIYIKPSRSINWINLSFIAVGSSVTFEEAVGMK